MVLIKKFVRAGHELDGREMPAFTSPKVSVRRSANLNTLRSISAQNQNIQKPKRRSTSTPTAVVAAAAVLKKSKTPASPFYTKW